MRIYLVALVFTVAACDDNGNSHVKNDLSMTTEPDLSMGGEDSMFGPDFSMMPDLTPLTPSGMIQQVRMAAGAGNTPDGGMIAMSIPVEGVFVTYVKPNVPLETEDAPGFFVQADNTGPAVYVRVDPASLSPVPQVGDQVQFVVTGVDSESSVKEATSITNFSVASSGHDLSAMVQDLSSKADLVSGLNGYESELNTVNGTVSGSFASSGPGYVAAGLDTTVLVSPSPLPRLRVPSGVRDSLDLTNGCVVKVGPTPLWRFTTVAEVSGWVSADIAVTSCPQPKVVSARALTSTTVLVTFDRILTAGTVTQGAFTFTSTANAITTQSVSVTSPTTVTVTTTAQTTPQLYTVHVDNTVEDTRNQPIDPNANSFIFNGWAAPATLFMNEVNPDITSTGAKRDQIELRAKTAGSVSAFIVAQGIQTTRTVLATLPDLVVASGDKIVVHLNADTGVITETNVNGATACTNNTYCSAAWDVAGPAMADIGYSARFVTITDSTGVVQDTMAFTAKPASTGYPANWSAEMLYATTNGYWGGTCPNACANADADTLAVDAKTGGVAATIAGKSMQRNDDTVPAAKGDWKVAASTWGANN